MKLILLLSTLSFQLTLSMATVETTPVIGILTLHTSPKFGYPDGSTYIYTSYGKWVEQSEMRWIPISVYESSDVIADKLNKINGVLLTGGNEVMGTKELPSLYGKVVRQILDYSINQLNEGNVFPVIGICMGFQSIMVVLSDYEVKLEKVHNHNESLGMNFTPDTFESYLSLYFSDNQLKAIESQKLFYFHHRDGFTMDQINNHPYIKENIKVLGSSVTPKGYEVLSMFQHKHYPVMAVQFHPEKVQFEYYDGAVINKSEYAMQVNAGFSKVFRRLIGEVQAKLTTKEVLEYRISVKLEVKYGKADEAFVFDPENERFPREEKDTNVDETSDE